MKNVVIIGSGMGGLVTGAKLSKAGYNVTIIEKHFVAGGYATNFTRKAKTGEKVVFDVSLHGIGNLNKDRCLYKQLDALGVFEKIKPIRKKETATVVSKENEEFDIPDSFDAYKKAFIEKFPKEQEGLNKLFDFLKSFDEDMEKNVYMGDNLPKYVSELENISLYDFLKKYTQDEDFINLFSFLWLYYGLPPKEINAYYYLVAWLGYHIGGTYYIEGGGGAFSQALVDIIEENGGRVILREEVSKINTKDNKIISVETKNKKVFKGDIFVLNACLEPLLEVVDNKQNIEKYKEKLSKLQTSCSLTQLYIGLDTDPTNLGIDKADIFYNNGEDLQIGYNNMKDKKYEDAHFCIVNYNLLDKSLNKDTGFLCVTLGDFEGHWPERDTKDYQEQKEKVENIFLEKLYKLFPQTKGHVVITELGTPKTMKRYTNNKNGAVYGFAQDLENGGFNRIGQKTCFDNTYIASAWTQPGGGYEGAILSGIFCSNIILDKYRLEEEKEENKLLPPNMYMAGMIEEANKEFIKNQKISYLFNFYDIDKKYYIKIENNKIKLEKNINQDADVVINCSYKVWNDIGKNKISGSSAFREGSLSYKGDREKFSLMSKIFSSPPKKEEKKTKLANANLLIPLALVPFIIYWSLSSFYDNSTLFLLFGTLYPVLVMPIFKPYPYKNKITTIEISSIVCFALYGALSMIGYKDYTVYLEIILPLSIISSCFTEENAFSEYTKLGFEKEVSSTKLFKKINQNLAIMWAIIFLIQFMVAKQIFINYPIANVIYILSLLGGVISIIYPKKAMGE